MHMRIHWRAYFILFLIETYCLCQALKGHSFLRPLLVYYILFLQLSYSLCLGAMSIPAVTT